MTRTPSVHVYPPCELPPFGKGGWRKTIESFSAAVAGVMFAHPKALYSTRRPAEYEQVRVDRREAYEYLPTDDGHWQRAFDAQRLLARTGRHRAVASSIC